MPKRNNYQINSVSQFTRRQLKVNEQITAEQLIEVLNKILDGSSMKYAARSSGLNYSQAKSLYHFEAINAATSLKELKRVYERSKQRDLDVAAGKLLQEQEELKKLAPRKYTRKIKEPVPEPPTAPAVLADIILPTGIIRT